MNGKTTDRIILTLLAASAALAIGWGCSAPAVSHTSISGEVRNIEHWQMVWVGGVGSSAVNIPGLYEKSKYTAAEYCLKYVDEIKRELSRKYDRSFAENFPAVGVIEVELTGDKLSAYVPPFDTANPYLDIAPNDRPAGSYEESNLLGATASLFTDRDQVREVHLRLFDAHGTRLGDVFVGDSHEDSVKPEFVAKVIDEILRTGKFKGRKVLPVSASIEGD